MYGMYDIIDGPKGSKYFNWDTLGDVDPLKIANNRAVIHRAQELGLKIVETDYAHAIERIADPVEGFQGDRICLPNAGKYDVLAVNYGSSGIVPYIRICTHTEQLIQEIKDCAESEEIDSFVFSPEELDHVQKELIDAEWEHPDSIFVETLCEYLTAQQMETLQRYCREEGCDKAKILRLLFEDSEDHAYVFDGITPYCEVEEEVFCETFDTWTETPSLRPTV